MNSVRPGLLVLGLSVLLTLLFWGPLWCGYGLIGGDLYPYFFPQKAFLADRLHAGEFPLWNNLTGFGYPVLGESQTAAAYPPHLLAYYLLDVNSAYNVEHLLHYFVCFIGTWLFGRRIGLGMAGSILTAIVFTYGWFPPRVCLEWAIVTGAWLPFALWCIESFLQTRHWRYAIGLSIVIGLQLLAGHFHLAFITQLLVVAYSGWRICVDSQDETSRRWARSWMVAPILLSVFAGFLLAAVQLVPAWELKTRSSRATVGAEHDPSYGHLPPLYTSQLIAPWMWYSPLAIDGDETIRNVAELAAPWHWFGPHRDLDESLMSSRAGGLSSVATNKVEAHLYCGLIPLALAFWWLIAGRRRMLAITMPNRALPRGSTGNNNSSRSNTAFDSSPRANFPNHGEAWFWSVAAIVALVYATGWLLPIARYLPGFNFFRGPGRYGIVTTLAVAILAGRGLQQILQGRTRIGFNLIVGFVLWSTIGDLWLVSRMVTYAVMVSRPPINMRDQSPIRKLLMEQKQAPRLYAPGQNLGDLLGVSCLPVYLGIAPAQYSDRKFAGDGMPKSDESPRPLRADDSFSKWLRDCGVTHILTFNPLDEQSWQVDRVWQGIDPLLNMAWGRTEPLYLYQLSGSPGKASLVVNETLVSGATVPFQREANRIVVEVESREDSTLRLRELEYPGWRATIDGNAASDTPKSLFREIPLPRGSHRVEWTYRPLSVMLGLTITLLTVIMLASIAHVRYWHKEWLDRVLGVTVKKSAVDA